MRKLLTTLICILVFSAFAVTSSSCGGDADCTHSWKDATCETPRTCSLCGDTDGAPLGHVWDAANCERPKTCQNCNKTEGAPLGHVWEAATCEKPRTCQICHRSEGAPLGHDWEAATCDAPKTCLICRRTEGSSLDHVWNEATCQTPRTCQLCGDTDGLPSEHSYASSTVTAPTCQSPGVIKLTCTKCDHSYTESVTATEYTASQIYDMYLDSLGEIVTYNRNGQELALGSCFVYSEDGMLVTNYHVIENAYSAKVTISGITYDVDYVLAYDSKIDVAVLKINASGLQTAVLCNNSHAVGKTVYAFGSSKGLSATFSQGIITYSDRVLDGVSYVQHDAAISGGNSGGPLINSYGEVIGINTMTIRDSQNLNFAISVSELKDLDYSTSLTFKQFYEKESNVFAKMKSHITTYGTYNSSEGYYTITLGSTYNAYYQFVRYAFYYPATNTISLDYVASSTTDSSYFYVYFEITEKLNGLYTWYYFDTYEYEMRGTIIATTFTPDTLINYNYTNATGDDRTFIREISSGFIDDILYYFSSDWSYVGITPGDLGFGNY